MPTSHLERKLSAAGDQREDTAAVCRVRQEDEEEEDEDETFLTLAVYRVERPLLMRLEVLY